MTHLLVVGSPSLDTIHLGGEKIHSAGGAGLYTAMAAAHCGSQVSLLSPQPDPMPAQLQPIKERLHSWMGPTVTPEELPHFVISHVGDHAEYLELSFGAETTLVPEMLPDDISIYDCVHVIALGSAKRQHSFLDILKKRGAKNISAGTFIDTLIEDPNTARLNIEIADFFFMNEKEAVSLFGSIEAAKTRPGKILFITLGKKGSIVVQGYHQTHLEITPTRGKDPTGAGDTFGGGFISVLARGESYKEALVLGSALASICVEGVGIYSLERATIADIDHRQIILRNKVTS